jgi:hypothetical protein
VHGVRGSGDAAVIDVDHTVEIDQPTVEEVGKHACHVGRPYRNTNGQTGIAGHDADPHRGSPAARTPISDRLAPGAARGDSGAVEIRFVPVNRGTGPARAVYVGCWS